MTTEPTGVRVGRYTVTTHRAESPAALARQLAAPALPSALPSAPSPAAGPVAVAIVSCDADDLRHKRERAAVAVAAGRPLADEAGVYFEPEPWGPASIAFVFPGQGSQAPGMLGGYRPMAAFRQALAALDARGRAIFHRSLTEWVYGEGARLEDTRAAQAALGLVSSAFARLLGDAGVAATLAAGHSYGELVALWYAGALSDDGLLRVTEKRGSLLAAADRSAPGGMVAIAAGEADVSALLGGVHDVEIANLNAPRQTVVSGAERGLEAITAACAQRGVRAVRLKTACAFHSSRMVPAVDGWARFLAERVADGELRSPHGATVIANATAAPYPREPGGVANLLERQLVGRVRWSETCARLHERGARIFIEVGPGNVLTRMIGQNLAGQPHLALQGDPQGSEPDLHLARLFARLAAHGTVLRSAPPGSRRTAMPLHDDVVREFVVSNTRVVDRFLELGAKIVDATAAGQAGAGKDAVLLRFLDVTARVTSEFLSVQTRGLCAVPTARDAVPASAAVAALPPPAPVAALPPPAPVAVLPASAPVASEPEGLEGWLRAQVAQVTGFPPASIERDAAFSELGIDSLAFAELFSRLASRVPAARDRAQALFEARSIADIVALFEPGAPVATAEAVAPVAVVAPVEPTAPVATVSPIDAAAPGAGWSPRLAALRARLRAALAKARPTWTAEISDQTAFDELGLTGFEREALWQSTTLVEPAYALAGEALMATPTIGEALALLAGFERREAAVADPSMSGPDALARYERIEIAQPLPVAWPALPAQVALIGAPGATTERLRAALVAAGVDVRLLSLTTRGWSTGAATWALEDHARLAAELVQLRGPDGVLPIVFVASPGTGVLGAASEAAWTAEIDRNAIGLFSLAKALGDTPGGFAMTGRLGVVLPGNASACNVAARGVARALSHEWRGTGLAVASLTVDDAAIDDPLLALRIVLGHDGAHDLALRGETLFQAHVERRDLLGAPADEPAMARGGVALLFGGGVGIAAEIGVDLAARYGAIVVALGRTPWDGSDPYPAAATDAALAEAVHAELLGHARGRKLLPATLHEALTRARRQRELARTAARVVAAGGRFEYRRADVTSAEDVEDALAWIRVQLGPIELVVHAAGIVEDRGIEAKSVESFRRVLHTKVRSAFHLRRALRATPARRVALFSSLVAHTGNAGQADYCAANEVLGAVAEDWSRDGDTRVVSLLWSVWTETGLAGRGVHALMAHHALAGISSRDGARYFHAEVARTGGPPWVLVASPRTLEVMRRGPLSGLPEPQLARSAAR